MATRRKKTYDVEIPFEESINLHGNRMAMEYIPYRACRKKSTLENVLNILLIVMIVTISLMCISIAMAGFGYFTMKLAEALL